MAVKSLVVADTTKVRIFKQITTRILRIVKVTSCCWYHKGTNFQANHNTKVVQKMKKRVVADTTKVRIFKQITTTITAMRIIPVLLLIPQRYEFSSKSQLNTLTDTQGKGCCWYHKGTNFQANHNQSQSLSDDVRVVADTTKVRIFKQITTKSINSRQVIELLLIPQRYEFSSKSQPVQCMCTLKICCCWYHKGTNFQANHNKNYVRCASDKVVADTTKVRIFKQITT